MLTNSFIKHPPPHSKPTSMGQLFIYFFWIYNFNKLSLCWLLIINNWKKMKSCCPTLLIVSFFYYYYWHLWCHDTFIPKWGPLEVFEFFFLTKRIKFINWINWSILFFVEAKSEVFTSKWECHFIFVDIICISFSLFWSLSHQLSSIH